jgi:hypothetical protein
MNPDVARPAFPGKLDGTQKGPPGSDRISARRLLDGASEGVLCDVVTTVEGEADEAQRRRATSPFRCLRGCATFMTH